MNVVIVAPNRSDNSLGRALSLADAYREVGSVHILAGDDGPLWQGARHSTFEIEPFSSPSEIARVISAVRPNAVVAVKPFRRSLNWTVKALRGDGRGGPRPGLVIDLDDYDVAIHTLRHLPPVTRAKRLIRSDLSPLRMRARIRWLLPSADMLTVSSWALRGVLPPFRGPELRIPHPRPSRDYAPPVPSDRLRLGFLGTPVRYKGMDVIGRLVGARPNTELHVLEGTQAAFASVDGGRLVVHPQRGADTLAEAFRHVDVIVLPQDPSEPAARYQLPAKLIDALRFGRPVVATDTPPIREIAGPSVALVASWEHLDAGLRALESFSDRERREALGRQGGEVWARSFSSQALSGQLTVGFTNAGLA